MTLREKLKMAGQLTAFFFKIGFFTFGGGWSILAQMQKEFVEKRHWLTETELLDIASVGRSLPGVMIANITMLFGNQMGGPICGFAAVIGISLPPFIVLGVVTSCYTMVKDNAFVARALVGVRAAIVPIIGFAAFKLGKAAFLSWSGYGIAAAACGLSLFTGINSGLIVILGAIVGLLIMRSSTNDLA